MRIKSFILVCFAAAFLFAGCQNLEQEGRPFSLYQVESIAVTPGDNCVKVAWVTQNGKPDPEAFIVSWMPDAAALGGGQQSVAPDKRELLVEGLENDFVYQFTVQAQYAGGLSQKVSEKCTPRTSRLPVTDFTANAGDGRILLRWKKPDAIVSSYKITWTPGAGSQVLTDTSLERYMVERQRHPGCRLPDHDEYSERRKTSAGYVRVQPDVFHLWRGGKHRLGSGRR